MKTLVHTSVLGLVLVAGCATPRAWYAPGHLPEDATAEQARARLAFTSMQMQQGPALNSYSAGYLAGESMQRGRFVHDWMEAKGYRLVPVNQIPTNSPVKLGNHTD